MIIWDDILRCREKIPVARGVLDSTQLDSLVTSHVNNERTVKNSS
jgi:hypothetical protein